ncbi:hypothetical protein MMC07_002796 [Pseudocyphellaria aurata]|nr:hypothetical protein [Pseudocyphellaria aurata]
MSRNISATLPTHGSTAPTQDNLDPPSSFQLPGLPPSLRESLTSGTSIPPPPPSPPPPQPVLPATPKKTSPSISHRNLPSSDRLTSSMPGAFPSSPPTSPNADGQTPKPYSRSSHTTSAFAPTTAANPIRNGTPNSKSPKRPGSLRNLLSFKNSTRSANGSVDPSSHFVSNSSHADPYRPASPGASSLASSFRSSLGRRKSGSFWTRRKSSLGMYSEGTNPSQIGGTDEVLNSHGTVHEDGGEPQASNRNVDSGEYASPTLRKRKSATFWRRKSIMGLNGENGYHAQHSVNGNGDAIGIGSEAFPAEKKDLHDEDDVIEIEHEDPRPRSPPPIIPEIDGIRDGGYLGGEEMFRHIG